MDANYKSLTYRYPELYEQIYQDSENTRAKMFEQILARNLNTNPASILDIGCGTARDLAYLANSCTDCTGIDYLEQNINFAKSQYPTINFQQGDIRTLQLGHSFETIICSGATLCHLIETKDLKKAFQTFANHACKGTLLILGVYNAFLYVGNFKTHAKYDIPSGKYAGTSKATFEFIALEQRLIGKRIWDISSLEDTEREDYFEFRLFSPMELEYYLNDYGFKVVEKFDISKEKNTHPLSCTLFIVSVFQGE
ncbi:methyltransferase family protein [Leptolyngbya sp. PCC 7375]|nr:methyltransferase family protein [Leptolyngbya sp. PCC 7375]